MPVNKYPRNTLAKCDCGEYSFPHRKGGGACKHNKSSGLRDFYQMLRQGVCKEEAMAELSARDLDRLFPIHSDS